MKILVVAQTYPWPQTTGARMRLANVLWGLGRVGEIDLCVLADADQDEAPVAPHDLPIDRLTVMKRPRVELSGIDHVRWLVGGRMPLVFMKQDFAQVRERFGAWSRPQYDVAWLCRAASYVALRDSITAPIIVDLDDLEDRKVAARMARTPFERDGSGIEKTRTRLASLWRVKHARLWKQLHTQIAASVDAVVVCSEHDHRHLGVDNAFVVPNGYPVPEKTVGKSHVLSPPTIAFQGFLLYPPNRDAAHTLVERIAPLIRAQIPQVQVRLVGECDEQIRRLHRPPDVVVTGFVPEVVKELARADLIAVPIRFGGGTRIKILEAFAHRIPVVSTSIGAEGIEAVDGHEILLGDTPQAFANACVRALTDQPLRRALADAAHRLFVERYRWDDIHPRIASLATEIAARSARAVHA